MVNNQGSLITQDVVDDKTFELTQMLRVSAVLLLMEELEPIVPAGTA